MSWFQYLFSFNGRVNRARMWLFYVVAWAMEMTIFLAIFLIYSVLLAAGIADKDALFDRQSAYPGVAFTISAAAVFIALYYMYFAVTAKRLHDRNKSAWWILIFLVIPVLLVLLPQRLIETSAISLKDGHLKTVAAAVMLAGAAIYIWGFVELYCLHGTVGGNSFGPDPLAGRV